MDAQIYWCCLSPCAPTLTLIAERPLIERAHPPFPTFFPTLTRSATLSPQVPYDELESVDGELRRASRTRTETLSHAIAFELETAYCPYGECANPEFGNVEYYTTVDVLFIDGISLATAFERADLVEPASKPALKSAPRFKARLDP